MKEQDYQFLILGNFSPFEPFLTHELSKRARLLVPTPEELPLNDPGLICAFLTIRNPDAVFYGPNLRQSTEKGSHAIIDACAHALQTKESLLVSWSSSNEVVCQNRRARSLFLILPEIIFTPYRKNFISECMKQFLVRKRIQFKDAKRTSLIGTRLLSKMLAHSSFRCLANPELCGQYRLQACGSPTKTEIAERIYGTMRKLLPEQPLAKAEFLGINEGPRSEDALGSNEEFMMNFNFILPSWQQQIDEAVAYQLPLLYKKVSADTSV